MWDIEVYSGNNLVTTITVKANSAKEASDAAFKTVNVKVKKVLDKTKIPNINNARANQDNPNPDTQS